ncbi:lasso peptide biosynthesis B2 protein [Streptomyces sp. NPDC046887]|uniref:lasso peptide biosynthesis B2 protein n=1 Tax=Streptomyces sp. NPDC046887 TaxID=3155472 RepID=UPI0033F0BA42
MSMSVAAGEPAALSWHRHLTARAAVGAARLLVTLPPRRLRRFLEVTGAGTRPATEDQALAARRAVVAVSSRCAGQGCLQRSVATVLLCQLRGVRPDWSTGVRTQPFVAHAWVEVDGKPVGESDDIRLYHPLMSVRRPPRGPRR